MTPIGNRLELALNEEYMRMQNEWFFKWHFIGEQRTIEIESFQGQPICYGGIKFEGSPQQVYWGTIQLYLRKKISGICDGLEIELSKYPHGIRSESLIEARSVLHIFATKIRRTAIETDRILRGNGFKFPGERDLGSWQGSQPSDIDDRIKGLRDIYCALTIPVDGVEMPFNSLMKDKVTFTKKDGTLIRSDISASVQPGRIFTFTADLPIEVGDHFLRQLPSGLVEDFIVDDPGFMAGGAAIASHFQTKVHRSGQPMGQPQTIINNIVGHNARVNINSVDSSTNSVAENSPAVFAEIQAALLKIESKLERERIANLVSEMARAHAKQTGFKETYQHFIATAAEHMTILAPFLPALSKLL